MHFGYHMLMDLLESGYIPGVYSQLRIFRGKSITFTTFELVPKFYVLYFEKCSFSHFLRKDLKEIVMTYENSKIR